MHSDVVGLVALALVLAGFLAGVPGVALVFHIVGMNLDDPAAYAASL